MTLKRTMSGREGRKMGEGGRGKGRKRRRRINRERRRRRRRRKKWAMMLDSEVLYFTEGEAKLMEKC